ncbi:mitochondrial fission ELM1 family protein [Candidatus Nitrosacidococcus tergens]|uniref:Nucleoside-diphosphate-sugar epimerase n=1 Tax=Candidatus Nitrosacidococcus tergens TaxID=553981 RepID=A0A7G1Q8G7_9GAMM|nr:mitochondrial fission ELM1 family protein [Candidatus Nitrosacidococcus tergens]CAB1274990.1 conserved protein of unknown function [Candidatus Nitrosacidococcus tergens]
MIDSTAHQSPCAWVITDGKIGMENQARGLAEAMNILYVVKQAYLCFPWSHLSPFVRLGKRYCLKNKTKLEFIPPWPNLIIACGRKSILPALMVKEECKAKIIYLQSPVINTKHFDLVIAPTHDSRTTGKNVLYSIGAPHQVTEQKLAQARNHFAHLFSKYPQPRLGILLGGDNKAYHLDQNTIKKLIQELKILIAYQSLSVFITPSRRTDSKIIQLLKNVFKEFNSKIYIWDAEKEENPYFGILAWSDFLLVSCESVSMISEACATHCPVYLLNLPGRGDKKFQSFHQNLENLDRIKWWEGKLEQSSTKAQPFNETKIMAAKALKYLCINSEKNYAS